VWKGDQSRRNSPRSIQTKSAAIVDQRGTRKLYCHRIRRDPVVSREKTKKLLPSDPPKRFDAFNGCSCSTPAWPMSGTRALQQVRPRMATTTPTPVSYRGQRLFTSTTRALRASYVGGDEYTIATSPFPWLRNVDLLAIIWASAPLKKWVKAERAPASSALWKRSQPSSRCRHGQTMLKTLFGRGQYARA